MNLHILFALPPRPSRGWRRRAIVARLVRAIGRQTFDHVAFGDDEITLSTSADGDRMYSTVEYIARYPGQQCAFTVPLAYPVPVRHLCRRGKPSFIPTIIRWLTRVPVPTLDCVQRARAALALGGVPSPNLTTTDELWDWLRASGFHFWETAADDAQGSFQQPDQGDAGSSGESVPTSRRHIGRRPDDRRAAVSTRIRRGPPQRRDGPSHGAQAGD